MCCDVYKRYKLDAEWYKTKLTDLQDAIKDGFSDIGITVDNTDPRNVLITFSELRLELESETSERLRLHEEVNSLKKENEDLKTQINLLTDKLSRTGAPQVELVIDGGALTIPTGGEVVVRLKE